MTLREEPRADDGHLPSVLENLVAEPDMNDQGNASPPIPSRDDVLRCQFSSWFPAFSNVSGYKRSNVTIKSVVLEDLPGDFKHYLLSDGVRLPVGATNLSSFAPAETADDQDDAWSSEEEDEGDERDEQGGIVDNPNPQVEKPIQFSFPDLNERIGSAISSLGGSVVPKLNWSSPKDATWLNGGTLKCQTPGDVYLLLKSSDFCLHDVMMHALEDCREEAESICSAEEGVKLQLVLRKWCNLYPNMEFRCFVKRREIVGISQRNHTQHYPHLRRDKLWIQGCIETFFDDVIRDRFGVDSDAENYVFDVYIDKKERVWLLDFNPWSKSTDSLLFEWSELQVIDCDEEPELRLVETDNQVRQDPLASYRAPIDTVDLATMTQGDAKQFEEFMKSCRKPSEMNGDDEGAD